MQKNRGQATTEYILIALMLVVALGVPFGDDEHAKKSVIMRLSDIVKEEYKAYKYAHSIGDLPL